MQDGTSGGSTTPAGARRYTLEELATAAGMTTRNVRAYQTRKLLPRPARQGRRSAYTHEHLVRLLAVQRARERGASLELIASHLASGGTLDGVAPAVGDWLQPRPVPVPRTPVAWSPVPLPRPEPVVEGLTQLHLLREDDGTFLAPTPVVQAGDRLAAHGFPATGSLTVALRAGEAAVGLGKLLTEVLTEAGPLDARWRPEVVDLAAHVVGMVLDDVLSEADGRPG